jgi:hypothetical protein
MSLSLTFSLLVSWLYLVLSVGMCVRCHIALAFRFSLKSCLISRGILLKRFCGSSDGMDWVAACCMAFVSVSIANSRSSWVFNLIFRFILLVISSLYFSQLVLWLCNLEVLFLIVTDELMVAIMGVWSNDRSKLGTMSVYPGEIPFVTKKSSRSGIFAGYVGQYVGVPLIYINNCYLA